MDAEIERIIDRAELNSLSNVLEAQKALNAALSAVKDVGYGGVAWNGIDALTAPILDARPVAPIFSPVTLTLPEPPGDAPALQEPSPISIGTMPTLNASAPSLSFPNRPSGVGPAPDVPEIDTNFVFPDPPAALSNDLPAAPVFAERVEPTAPEITLPDFEGQSPGQLGAAPADGQTIMDDAYAAQVLSSQANADAYTDAWIKKHNPEYHVQMALLEDRLATYLSGGTGLKPDVEDAIYARAREKNDIEAARVRDAGYAEAASRGFTLPSGALMAGIARARQDAANNNLKAASDIVVMQAELEQKNLQFAVTTSASLRTTMASAALNYMGHVVSINGQAMDYAKAVFSNVAELYNASVRAYSARVDAYRGYASVYETRIKAAMAKIDVYRAEIAALEAMTNVDQSRAAIYKIQLDATQSMVALYRAQIEAVQGRASLEKLKLDLFQGQVQAFGAQVQAKNAEWGSYNAAISGEEAKARIYGTQVSAFTSQLEAHRTTIAAKISEIDATTRTNQAKSAMHGAQVQIYTALVGAESERARAENDNNRQLLIAFDKELSAFQAATQVKLAQYTAESEIRIKSATSDLSAQVEMARAKTEFGKLIADLHQFTAKTYADLAGASMAGINTLVGSVENS